MVEADIIQPINEPTKFCSPMVVTYHKSGDIQIVTNLQWLNELIHQEEFQMLTLEELAFRQKVQVSFQNST